MCGYAVHLALVAAVALYAGSRVVRRFGVDETLFGVVIGPPALLLLSVAAVVLAAYGGYRFVGGSSGSSSAPSVSSSSLATG